VHERREERRRGVGQLARLSDRVPNLTDRGDAAARCGLAQRLDVPVDGVRESVEARGDVLPAFDRARRHQVEHVTKALDG